MTLIFQLTYLMVSIGCICGLYRLYKGPRTLDRILAFDYLCACIIVFTVVYSLEHETSQFLELILIFSLLGFATVVSFMEAFFRRAQERDDG